MENRSDSFKGKETYVGGHGVEEERRLDLQAELLEPSLERLLRDYVHLGDSVADFGTGRGNVALLMERLVGSKGSVYAVDRLPGAMRISREKFAERGHAVHLLQGDITKLPLADNALHCGYARFILMHLTSEQRDAAIEEMKRTVKNGGHIISQEPVWEGWEVEGSRAFPKFFEIATQYNQRFGKELRMGEQLDTLFRAHGLAPKIMKEQEVLEPSRDSWLIPYYWLKRSQASIVQQEMKTSDGHEINDAYIENILTEFLQERADPSCTMKFTPMYTAVAQVKK